MLDGFPLAGTVVKAQEVDFIAIPAASMTLELPTPLSLKDGERFFLVFVQGAPCILFCVLPEAENMKKPG
jgi:hypothetical protein